jgi:uncharacterized membrane protein
LAKRFSLVITSKGRLLLSFGLTLLSFVTLTQRLGFHTTVLASIDIGLTFYLGLVGYLILRTPLRDISRFAKFQADSLYVDALFIFGAGYTALFALVFIIELPKESLNSVLIPNLLLGFWGVVASWLFIQAMFGLKYASMYFDNRNWTDEKGFRIPPLIFRGDTTPDYVDFFYVAFSVGTAFQIADAQTSSRTIRRFLLIHGVLSFFFNTVILALAVSIFGSFLN